MTLNLYLPSSIICTTHAQQHAFIIFIVAHLSCFRRKTKRRSVGTIWDIGGEGSRTIMPNKGVGTYG